MKRHYLSALALLVMVIFAFGSVDTSDLDTGGGTAPPNATDSNGDATTSDARTIGYSAVYDRYPGASASIKTVDDLGNGKFHVAGRFTKKGSSSEQGFYIVMQFDPGENDSARIIEFDIIQ